MSRAFPNEDVASEMMLINLKLRVSELAVICTDSKQSADIIT